jgi:hypothetical protein
MISFDILILLIIFSILYFCYRVEFGHLPQGDAIISTYDPTGVNILPNCNISVKNKNTNMETTGITDSEGHLKLTLPVGDYIATATDPEGKWGTQEFSVTKNGSIGVNIAVDQRISTGEKI